MTATPTPGTATVLGRFCALTLLTLTLASAAPTPQQVDREIRAGHYDQALMMLVDVRQERPLSATAEWLTASALFGKGDVQGAGEHLATARQLDPALTGAAPARVAQIDGALRGQERASFWQAAGLAALLLALAGLAFLLASRIRRARQARAARDKALDELYRRVKTRENEIEAEQLSLKIAALTDLKAQVQVRALEDELNQLYGALSEVQDGPVENMAAYPPPRKARAAEPVRPAGADAPSRQSGPSASRSGPASPPVTVVQSGGSGDLLTGMIVGQSLAPSSALEATRPAPAPEPERRTESAPASWDNPSSLTEDRKPSWEAPSSLSSSASYENSSSLSSSSSDSTPSSTDTSSSGSSDTSGSSSSDSSW